VNLETLDLSYNQIKTLKGLDKLKNLKELWLNSNKIETFEDLDLLAMNQELTTVYFGGNPVADFPGYRQKLIELLPKIEQIDAFMVKTQYKLHFTK